MSVHLHTIDTQISEILDVDAVSRLLAPSLIRPSRVERLQVSRLVSVTEFFNRGMA